MKKVLLSLVLTSLLAVPMVGLANSHDVVSTPCSTYGESQCLLNNCQWNPSTSKCLGTSITDAGDLITLINRIGNWIFAALLALAAIFLIVAGWLFVTAGGNVESTTKARQMLVNALIGVAIGLGAKGLIAVVTGLLG